MKHGFFAAFTALTLTACGGETIDAPKANMDLALEVFETLSSDEMAGRYRQTEGHEKAREYLESQILKSGYFDSFEVQEFPAKSYNRKGEVTGEFTGYNLIAHMDRDPADENPVLIVTAHYDHLGVRGDKIYNGADDNASGCAALFAIAESFHRAAPDHDLVFVWLDAEETGLQGARSLTENDKIIGTRRAFNLNLDMISQNQSEIYLVGTHHYPLVKPVLERAADNTDIALKTGHDRPEDGDQDWTLLSDHGAFHEVGIPFAYFGVEDHKHYHRHTDEFETIPLEFYEDSVQTIVNAAHFLDENLGDLARYKTGKN